MSKYVSGNQLLFFLVSLFGITQAQYRESTNKDEPFPSNPIGMQTYINKTTPNVAIVFDNSITMRYKITNRALGAKLNKKLRPRRVDIVKDASLTIIDRYHDTLNFSFANITDYARDLHWEQLHTPNYTLEDAGYIFAPAHGTKNSHNMESYDSRLTYTRLPFEKNNPLKERQRTPGTGVDLNSSFVKNLHKKYTGSSPIAEQALPEVAKKLTNSIRKKMGLSLLVPHQDIYSPRYNSDDHKEALKRAIKTTGLRSSVMQYIYPNYIEYMAKKIQYRCQDTFMLAITDGNTLTNSYNKKAAQKYFAVNKIPNIKKQIGLRPKPSTERDDDGAFYNGPDFSDQNIRSYAIGIGTNPNKFKKFELFGGGKAAVAADAEDILDIMDEFMLDMHPSNTFSMTSPTGSFLYTDDSTSMLVANINTTTKGWIGELRFSKKFSNSSDIDDHEVEFAKYLPNHAVISASTEEGLLNLSNEADRKKLNHKDLNLNNSLQVENYLKWLIGYTKVDIVTIDDEDTNTSETFEVYRGDRQDIFKGLRSRAFDGLDERRFLGDVLSSSLEMIGPLNKTIKAPEYLTVGSNDGMFKIYTANPEYGKFLETVQIPIYDENDESDNPKPISIEKVDMYDTNPYIYNYAYLPGTSEKNNGFNILQSLIFRTMSGYGSAPRPLHQYAVNGETAFRTTPYGHTFLVSTLGQGGKGAFALNVSGIDEITHEPIGLSMPKNTWAQNVPLWDTSSQHFGYAKENSQDLGYILGRAVIGRVALNRRQGIPDLKQNIRYAAVLPSGVYNEKTNEIGPTVYIYDALGIDASINSRNDAERTPGKLIKKVTYKLSNEQKAKYKFHNSLSEVAMIDLDKNGVMDIGYAGDLNGNLYRLNLRGNTPEDWSLDLIFEGDPNRPIVQAPSLSRFFQRPMVIFGTGSLMHNEFSNTEYEQVLYGIMENKNFTAYQNQPLMENDKRFIEQAIDKQGNQVTISSNRPPLHNFVGWKLPIGRNLKKGSEILAQKPIIFNGTIFLQTYIYRDNQNLDWKDPNTGEMKELMCFRSLDTADTWLYQINAITGGALDSNSSYLKHLGVKTSGKKTEGLIDRPVKLVVANKSPSMTTDGEMISGNDKDIHLDPMLSSNDNFTVDDSSYITGEGCQAMLTNGMEIICPTSVINPHKIKLHPGRLSLIKRL